MKDRLAPHERDRLGHPRVDRFRGRAGFHARLHHRGVRAAGHGAGYLGRHPLQRSGRSMAGPGPRQGDHRIPRYGDRHPDHRPPHWPGAHQGDRHRAIGPAQQGGGPAVRGRAQGVRAERAAEHPVRHAGQGVGPGARDAAGVDALRAGARLGAHDHSRAGRNEVGEESPRRPEDAGGAGGWGMSVPRILGVRTQGSQVDLAWGPITPHGAECGRMRNTLPCRALRIPARRWLDIRRTSHIDSWA